eukprot:scaffold23479_cov143-Cylindrotheca_fusiformis.AAC.10
MLCDIGNDHTNMTAPLPVRSAKLSMFGPGCSLFIFYFLTMEVLFTDIDIHPNQNVLGCNEDDNNSCARRKDVVTMLECKATRRN